MTAVYSDPGRKWEDPISLNRDSSGLMSFEKMVVARAFMRKEVGEGDPEGFDKQPRPQGKSSCRVHYYCFALAVLLVYNSDFQVLFFSHLNTLFVTTINSHIFHLKTANCNSVTNRVEFKGYKQNIHAELQEKIDTRSPGNESLFSGAVRNHGICSP